ncbi:MAG: nitrilase-related carbon-nitrogen hydrolase [Bdellovibrionales bacterium]
MNSIKVGLAQLTSVDDKASNFDQIINLLKKIEGSSCQIVFFPENSLFLRINEGSEISPFSLSDSFILKLQIWADQFKCAIHLGSVPVRVDEHIYNASVWLEPGKKPRISYIKMHLFDIALEGQKPIRESDVFTKGPGPQILEYLGWRFGQTICYDIRFSYLFDFYAKEQVDAILIPSAFLMKTGEAHWDILNRARAIETQAYVISSAQGGEHKSLEGRRLTYGHSLIIDPWGRKLVELENSPSISLFEIEREVIMSVRRQIPMSDHRRQIKSVTES